MPDRHIDLFIRCCLQNNGTLSQRKRADLFAMLTDDEILKMEKAIRSDWQGRAVVVRSENLPRSD